MPLAYYKENAIHFQHRDWVGSERVTTSASGSTETAAGNYPFGDGLAPSGRDIDPYHYAQLDHNNESGNERAQFRELSSRQGHWMSPDPYSGSYNSSNPQSLNRYAYASNNPVAVIDPSGLSGECFFGCGGGPGYPAPPFFSWGGPKLGVFHGKLGPRPTVPEDDSPQATGDPDWSNPLSEHLGLPAGTVSTPDIFGALGLPEGSCEFGACGGGFGYTEGRGDSPPLISVSMGVDAVWGGLLDVAKVARCAIVGAGKGLQSSLYKRPQLNTPPGEGSLARLGYGAYKTGAPALVYRLSQGGPFSRLAGDFVPYVGQGILLIQGGIALNDASQVFHECASKVIQ